MLKKPVILMVMSLVVIISATTITKNYSFNAPVIQEGCVFMDNCDYLGSSFNPDVAVKTTSLLLQQGHTVESFSVKYGEPILLQDNFNIRPFRPGGRISIEPPPDLYRTLGEAYTKDAFFPAITRDDNNYRIIYKNGHAIFVAMIKPVQYNPESKKVRYYPNISIQVNTVKANANQTPVYKCNKFIRSQLKEMVDNPETIDNLPDSPRGPNDYEYLIITGTSFKDRWTDFIAFNERRCLRTNVVTTDDIYGSGVTGKDNPDKIRNYIKKEYTDNNIVYVMLGGDVEIVPCRGMHTEFYDYGVNHYEDWTIAADLYYSCLDGTWQKPGSNYYGEYGCDEDVGWEVYASRFAVDNNTELANMINKTIMYSETPVANDVENVILGGEELWNQWRWDDAQNKYVQLSSKCYGGDNMEEMIGTCTNNGYTTVGWPSNINFSKLYEKDGSWTGDMKTKMISTIRNDKITFIDHLGHSNTNYILKMSTSDVNSSNFQNNGTNANFFIVYTQGCYPGSFDNKTPGGSQTADCIGEKFATLSTAAVAFISNTRYGLGADGREGSTGNSPYTDGSSSRFQRCFHDGISKNLPLEMANGHGKEMNITWVLNSDPHGEPYHGQMKYCFFQVNILGDPALYVWTAKPMNFTNTPSISGTTFNLETPAHSWVALLDKDKKIVATQFTGEGTNSNCALTYANMSEVKFYRVKAQNHLPFEGPAPVTAIHNNAFLGINEFVRINTLGHNVRVNFNLAASDPVNLSIYNSRGSLVKSAVNKTSTGAFVINNISNGIYYLRLQSKNVLYNDKFIVSR